MNCDNLGCEEEAEFFDDMQNALCSSCVEQDMEEKEMEPEDYEMI